MGFAALMKEQEKVEFMIEKLETGTGSAYLTVYRHSVIAMWVLVELTADETIRLALQRSPLAWEAALASGIKHDRDSTDPIDETEARLIADRVEKRLRKTIKGNRAKLLGPMLQAFRVPLMIDPHLESELAQLCYCRNCLLHKGGRVDHRAAIEAPGLPQAEGEILALGETEWSRYYDAAGSFGRLLIEAVGFSPYTFWNEPTTGKVIRGDERAKLSPENST